MSSPNAIPLPVNPGDPGRGPMVVAVTWVFTIIAAIAVSLWVYTRRKQRIYLGWDLWLMIIALLVRIAFQITITYSLRYGLGKHDRDLTPDQLVQILKWNWIALPGALVTSTLARMSITILLIRLFGVHKKFKWFLIIVTGIQCVGAIVFVIMTFAQVTPVTALWEIFTPPRSHWDPRIWLYTAYFVQSFYTFSDLTYVLFPVMFICKLNMPLRRRVGLMLLMCVSLFTMVMSILKTVWIASASKATALSTDVQYDASYQALFGPLEQCFVIIMGCIPSLRNLVNMEAGRLTSLVTRLSDLLKKTGHSSKGSTSDMSSDIYHRVEEQRTGRVGPEGIKTGSHSVNIASYGQRRSDEEMALVDHGQIRRTDQWTVSSYDRRTENHSRPSV